MMAVRLHVSIGLPAVLVSPGRTHQMAHRGRTRWVVQIRTFHHDGAVRRVRDWQYGRHAGIFYSPTIGGRTMKRIRLGVAMLALSTLTILVSGGSALAQPQPAWPIHEAGSSATGGISTQQAEQQPGHSLPDLTVTLVSFNRYLDIGEQFKLAAVVRNQGVGTAKPVRVLIGVPLPFKDVKVIDAPGFSCTVETQGGYLPGHWVICKGGQVPDNRDIWIGIEAKAPHTPGTFNVVAIVDPQRAVDERNEENNDDLLTLHVRDMH
jgi:hypothetical protein